MRDDHRGVPLDSNAIENIDRWKRAMDGIARTFVDTGVNPAEGLFIMAKCIGHALQEVPDATEREKLLSNLMNIIRRIMQQTDPAGRKTFVWN